MSEARTDFRHDPFLNFTWKYNQWVGACNSRSLSAPARSIQKMKKYLNDHNTHLELCYTCVAHS